MKPVRVRSLRSRMLLALGGSIALAWCASLAAIYGFSSYSGISIWDDKLQSIAVKMLQMVPSATLGPPGSPLQLRQDVVAENNGLSFQIWDGHRRLLAGTDDAPAAPMSPGFEEGFSNVSIRGESWRVYSVSDRAASVFVQVGNPRRLINAAFHRNALTALGIATALLSMAGLLMAWAVRKALRPLSDLEAALLQREKLDMTPLPDAALPGELLPLIHSFNQLLGRLESAVQAERTFIGDAAHELRTPIAALQAHAEVALNDTTLAGKDAALAKLLAVTERSARLSEQLLDLARLEAGGRVPKRSLCALPEIVRHVAGEFEITAQRSGRTLEVACEPCHIRCDLDEVGILLRNLVDNALRYTLPGGVVRVCCGVEGDSAFVEVVDDGPGVPEEEREAIFERFHRVVGAPVRGSGIGLSLVARIAQLHRARIETGTGLGAAGFRVRLLFPALKEN